MTYYSTDEESLAAQLMVQTLWKYSPPDRLDLCCGQRCPMGQEKVVVWT